MSDMVERKPDGDSMALAENSIKSSEEIMHTFLETARVAAVYGAPVEHGDKLVIPSAEVVSAMGYGSGVGGGEGGAGGGSGGGGRTFSRPVAVIISGPDGIEVEPVVDVTKIALALFTLLGFVFSLAGRMRRGRIKD